MVHFCWQNVFDNMYNELRVILAFGWCKLIHFSEDMLKNDFYFFIFSDLNLLTSDLLHPVTDVYCYVPPNVSNKFEIYIWFPDFK